MEPSDGEQLTVQRMSASDKFFQRFDQILCMVRALVVRSILVCHAILAYGRVADILQDKDCWYMLFLLSFLLVESVYTIVKRRGQEYKWFCPCFLFYLMAVIPAIWMLELDRLNNFNVVYKNASAQQTGLSSIQGVSLPIKLTPNLWVSVIEQSLLFLMILGRWILPRGELTRDQLSQLLFVYIGMASDIMELFVMFDETDIRADLGLTYSILVIWTVSLLQFTLVLTATANPKKPRTAIIHPEEAPPKSQRQCCGVCLQTELWSLLVSIFMQDGPFLTVRLYALVKYHLVTYSIIFFTCKNMLILMLLFYRLLVLCVDYHTDDDDDDDVSVIKAPGDKGQTTEAAHVSEEPSGKENAAANLDDF